MTLALARSAPPTHELPELRLVPALPQERCVYAASTRGRPVALAASAGVVALITTALAVMNASPVAHARKAAPQVIELELVPPVAPPPPRATAPDRPPPPSAIVAPVREVVTPLAPQPVATTTEVAPPAPPVTPPVEQSRAVDSPGMAAPAAAAGPSDAGDLSAKMIQATPPRYPEESRRKREQGTVKVRVLVGLDGKVEQASVDSSSGSSRLDSAALNAVRRWRWSPLVRDGVAVMVRGFVTIPFVLRT